MIQNKSATVFCSNTFLRSYKMRYLTLVYLFLLALSSPAEAEKTYCFDREDLVEELVADFGEQLAAVRDIKGEGLLEIHVSARTGTWTALLTRPGNLSCVVASGSDAPIPEFLDDVRV